MSEASVRLHELMIDNGVLKLDLEDALTAGVRSDSGTVIKGDEAAEAKAPVV
jgi:hypothetical protein